ncbi:hypothetical protein HaLaN_12177, partial [Haematococcus lacustris]
MRQDLLRMQRPWLSLAEEKTVPPSEVQAEEEEAAEIKSDDPRSVEAGNYQAVEAGNYQAGG